MSEGGCIYEWFASLGNVFSEAALQISPAAVCAALIPESFQASFKLLTTCQAHTVSVILCSDIDL